MNTFANTLFSAMLGWVRDIIASIFRMAENRSASVFLRWMADNWLPLAAVIIIAGIVLDLLVWLVRWRPHYVWLSNFRSFRRNRQPKGRFTKDFATGYGQGVGYEFYQDNDSNAPGVNQAVPESYEMPAFYQAPGLYSMPGQAPGYAEQMGEQPPDIGLSAYYPVKNESNLSPGGAAAGQAATAERRRRSDKHKPRLFGSIGTVGKRLLGDIAGEQYVDGLPPLIAKRDAFHDPVYPSRDPLDNRQATRAAPVYVQPVNGPGQDGESGR